MVRELLGVRAEFPPFAERLDGASPLPLFWKGTVRRVHLLGSVQFFVDRLYHIQRKKGRAERLGHPQVQGRVFLVVLLHFQAHGDGYLCGFNQTARDLPVPVRTSDKNGVRRSHARLAPGVDQRPVE